MANTAISNTIIQGAPSNASYITLATHTELLSERVLTAGTGITITDGGAGGTLTINADSPTTAATQSDQETATSTSTFVSPGRQQFHPSASKCWCEFDPSGTISASYNVTSVTDNGVGDWTVNIGTDFSSAAYTAVVSGALDAVGRTTYSSFSTTAGTSGITCIASTGTFGDPVGPIHYVAFGDQ